MIMRKTVSAVAALAFAAAVPAHANDSTAAMGAGGIVLTESADIRMAAEDLYVSKDLIRVRYQFVNESRAPILTRVAFPLPEANMQELSDIDVGWPTEKGDNVVDFRVIVEGQAVKPQLERKAFLKGKDVTADLLRLGVPLSPRPVEVSAAVQRLPAAAKAELMRLKLAHITSDFVEPYWVVKNTFHWQQTFPVGRPLKVEHTYRPIAGGSFFSALGYFQDPKMLDKYYGPYCVDQQTRKGLEARLKMLQRRDGDNAMMIQWVVDYVLTTGRNWKGPIGKFRLTLNKGKPDSIISFCMDGVRKTGPTTFVVERSNFEPDKDLSVMIFEVPSGN
jgi:hypothetical protein